ncbi:hypothetical protein [Nocardioides mangrovi]|uniref:DUF2613 family protein n=1 Tax=Nocardioides mangrovi TaxID=2874580 RepID=A0ABS7U7G5_9ACTN|nr:hypothetical protein [Nocardioides mangrovi]MBZ5736876.1 hypothetical protein [Nocardioides mangrovi]
MQAFLIGIVSIVVGGGLAGATFVGLVNSQTAAPDKSPADVNAPAVDYGNTK